MLHKLIFSNESKYRLARHLALWIAFLVYFFVVNFFPRSAGDFSLSETYIAAFQKLVYVPIAVFSVYVSIYFLLPKFILKGKYATFFLLFICLCTINLATAYLLTKVWAGYNYSIPFKQLPVQIRVFQPVVYGLGMGLAASVFAIIIKQIKIRYFKQKELEQLQQQKIHTELQMIRTHFHPNFLSSALQNISRLIKSKSPQSPEVILKLSDLLSYILYENEEQVISLDRELHMMKDYLDLEKSFYGDRITVRLKEEGDFSGKKIAPLILLSLVQHCCEQFLVSRQQKFIIDIEIKAEDTRITFRLSCNSYHDNIEAPHSKEAGLNQALRRIEVIYARRHTSQVNVENGQFDMTLILDPGMQKGDIKGKILKRSYEIA